MKDTVSTKEFKKMPLHPKPIEMNLDGLSVTGHITIESGQIGELLHRIKLKPVHIAEVAIMGCAMTAMETKDPSELERLHELIQMELDNLAPK